METQQLVTKRIKSRDTAVTSNDEVNRRHLVAVLTHTGVKGPFYFDPFSTALPTSDKTLGIRLAKKHF